MHHTPALPTHSGESLRYTEPNPGICESVGDVGVESFAETGWVSSDSGKEDKENRWLCQQMLETQWLFLHSEDTPLPTTPECSDHTRDLEDL